MLLIVRVIVSNLVLGTDTYHSFLQEKRGIILF